LTHRVPEALPVRPQLYSGPSHSHDDVSSNVASSLTYYQTDSCSWHICTHSCLHQGWIGRRTYSPRGGYWYQHLCETWL